MYQQKFLTTLIGKNVVAEAEISVSGLGTINGIKGVYLECSDGIIACSDLYPTQAFAMPDVAWSGVLKTQPFVASANTQQVSIKISLDGTIVGAGITVDISRISFRVID